MCAAEGKKPWLWRKARELCAEGITHTHTQNTSPKPVAMKTRGADFHKFLQWGSKTGDLWMSMAWLG